MTSLDKAIIGRIKKAGMKFEVYLDPDHAYAYLEGQKKDLKNILVVEEVFTDAKKGERASSTSLQKAFGTADVYEITERILKEGEVQLTTEQKRKMVEKRKKQIMDIILKNAIDVRTNAPIPPQRLELAFEQAKIHVDALKKPEQQVEEIVSKIRHIIPIKFEKINIAIKIPAQYAMKCYGLVKAYKIKKEEWTSSGDLIAVIEIPAGMQGEVYDKLAKATNGTVQTKVLERGV